MQELGIVVDVAHAHIDTLKGIVEMTGKPVIDSAYGSYLYVGTSWREKPLVERDGNGSKDRRCCVLWPLAFKPKTVQRVTFLDWARKSRDETSGLELNISVWGQTTVGF